MNTDNNNRPLAHTVDAACHAIGIGRSSLYELISKGEIDARRVAGRTVVLDASLRAFLENAPKVKTAA
jgi:excisionase family DNA binding protein